MSTAGRQEAASEILARRGSIASRLASDGLRVDSARYNEPSEGRQRAIYVGRDGLLVRRARALIERYREPERQVREVEEAAQFTSASGAVLRHLLAPRRGGPTRLDGDWARPGSRPGDLGVERGIDEGGTIPRRR